MSQLIRTGLIIAAVIVLAGTVVLMSASLVGGLVNANSFLSGTLVTIAPYLYFGKSLLNKIMGSSAVATFMLFLSLVFPLTYLSASLISRVYRLIIGKD